MIELPELFQKILDRNQSLAGSVRKSLDNFEPWLEQSGMPFFSGYTDHSPRHISDVLKTAASLISDASHDILSPDDVAILCISILLHDCGMHLTHDAFRALIKNDKKPIISGLGDKPWAQLWGEFLREAQRFGHEKLIAIFGDEKPFLIADLDLENLTERDCYLVGEFVRRHHTRLAHEIALEGVPAPGSQRLELVSFDKEYKDIAGLVARSHGMAIRATFPYLKDRYFSVREYRNIHPPFLMAILRIADYVQVRSERAIASLLSVKELRSPISRQEWRNHFAVRDVSTNHEDPEALLVYAHPEEVRTFLKLKALFADIQKELDESWATIGEVYGRFEGLSNLGLSWRRIRSNLDDVDQFSKLVTYVPVEAGFKSSGPDLLNLLVGPLYDYEYSIGIRELVQNAVDACKELEDINGTVTDESEPDVVVDIYQAEGRDGWIAISDKGVGMTLETVKNYFLTVGASFRNSNVWKEQHVDDIGAVKVLRGGRFGVGVLAAFLLGDEIEVTTRHAKRPESEGLCFKARIDDPIVELKRGPASAGTTIRIHVSNPDILKRIRPKLSFEKLQKIRKENMDEVVLDEWDIDWFLQAFPKVLYKWHGYHPTFVDDEEVEFSATFRTPSQKQIPIPGGDMEDWGALSNPEPFHGIYWRLNRKLMKKDRDFRYADMISVNGIPIERCNDNLRANYVSWYSEISYEIVRPSIAIFDPAGICPINLQRSSIAFDRTDIDGRLSLAMFVFSFGVIKDMLNRCENMEDIWMLVRDINTDEYIKYNGYFAPICFTKDGCFLALQEFFIENKIRNLIFLDQKFKNKDLNIRELLLPGEGVMFYMDPGGVQAALSLFRGAVGKRVMPYHAESAGFPRVGTIAEIAILSKPNHRICFEKGAVARDIIKPLSVKETSDKNFLICSGEKDVLPGLEGRASELFLSLGSPSRLILWGLSESITSNDFIFKSEACATIREAWINVMGGGRYDWVV